MTYPIKSPRKLIEVALPLDAINEACAYEEECRALARILAAFIFGGPGGPWRRREP